MTYDPVTWGYEFGAPEGPPFSIVVDSLREGHGPYRISRDDRGIHHEPPCEAAEHGRRWCRHVRIACEGAGEMGDHARAACYVIQDALNSSTWWAWDLPHDAEDLLGVIAQAIREWSQATIAANEARRAREVADIVREFNTPTLRVP